MASLSFSSEEWRLIGRLFPFNDEDPFISSAEVATRVCAAFPQATVDNKRANDLLQDELKKLEAQGTPSPILDGHKNLFDKTTFVEVRCPTNNNIAVYFLVYPDSAIDIFGMPKEFTREEQKLLQILVGNIAEVLAYDVEFVF